MLSVCLWNVYPDCDITLGCGMCSCGSQGLHQSVLFCGDGINDLSALSAADVGYAVGSTEASIAAAVTSPGSISGRPRQECCLAC